MPGSLGQLKRRAEFLRVAAARRKWAAPGMVVQAAKREGTGEQEEARVGFTVSKKVGNAVERNRARRRLRAAAKEVMPDIAEAATDYVIIGRRATLTRPFEALRDDLAAAVRHLASRKTSRRPTATEPAGPGQRG